MQVLKAVSDKRAPLFVEHVTQAAQGPDVDNPPLERAAKALIAAELCPRSLVRLDVTSTAITLAKWLRLVHLLPLMPLEHLSAALPLGPARRERSIEFEVKVPKVWSSEGGGAGNPPPCAEDIEALAEAAAAGGLRRLRMLDLLNSQLDAPCMAALGRLLAAVSPTLVSLNLHSSLRLYKLTDHGCCDVLVCDALRTLQRLQVLLRYRILRATFNHVPGRETCFKLHEYLGLNFSMPVHASHASVTWCW